MAAGVPGVSGPEYRRRAVRAGPDLLADVGYGTREGAWIDLGVAFVGNVGGAVVDFTALEDAVNVAARMQASAGAGELLVSRDRRRRGLGIAVTSPEPDDAPEQPGPDDRLLMPGRLELGSAVRCRDGEAGELADVVIDPATRRVTHLVVRPPHRPELGLLVPAEHARPAAESGEGVALDLTRADLDRLESVRELAYLRLGELPAADPDWDVGAEDAFAPPSSTGLEPQAVDLDPHVMVSFDRIPKGEVEIRRSSPVTAADGKHLGRVDGLVVDAEDQVSHLVLERGHLWGRREVVIPIGAVERVGTDEVVLSLSAPEVGALPAHRVHRWGRA